MSSATTPLRVAIVAREAARLNELAAALSSIDQHLSLVTALVPEVPDATRSATLLILDGEVALNDLLRILDEAVQRAQPVIVATRSGNEHLGLPIDTLGSHLAGAPRPLSETVGEILSGVAGPAGPVRQSSRDMLSRMSHELRTPLNAILGFAQVLELDDLTEDQSESVREIISAGRHLLAMINEVLEITRIESGRLSFSRENVALGPAIAEVCELAQREAVSRGITVTAAFDEACPTEVMADRSRLRQVLLQLLDNAVRYSVPDGEVTVRVGPTEPRRVRIAVCDTGPGIPPDLKDRLFTPFDRLGAERTGVAGVGLGLSLALRLAKAMGGSLGVDSAPDRGTTAWVELPEALGGAAVQEAEHGAACADGDADGRETTAHLVLCIEDNPANAALVESIVRRVPDCRMLHATTGERGLQLALEQHPAMILLDLNLPDIQGEEVLGRLRGHAGTEAIPVVVISADATERRIERLKSMGAAAYFTKPLDVERLRRLLEATRSAVESLP